MGSYVRPAKVKRWRDRLYVLQGGKCHWCGKLMYKSRGYDDQSPDQLTVDHVVRYADSKSHDRSNLVAACLECNWRREREDTLAAQAIAKGLAWPMPDPDWAALVRLSIESIGKSAGDQLTPNHHTV